MRLAIIVLLPLLASFAGGYTLRRVEEIRQAAPVQCAMEHIATAVSLIQEEGGDEDDISAIIESVRHPQH